MNHSRSLLGWLICAVFLGHGMSTHLRAITRSAPQNLLVRSVLAVPQQFLSLSSCARVAGSDGWFPCSCLS